MFSGSHGSPRFTTWEWGTSLMYRSSPSDSAKLAFKKLNDFKIPKAFLQQKFEMRGHKDFIAALGIWAISKPSLFQDDDVHNLVAFSQCLYQAYSLICRSIETEEKECSQRQGVDQIIQLAFSTSTNSVHRVMFEADIRMVSSQNVDVPVSSVAQADTLVVFPFPEKEMGQIDRKLRETHPIPSQRPFFANAYWSKEAYLSKPNSIIAFSGEFKRDHSARNQNQLAIDFGAAQSQRRALGLKDRFLWGATCSMGRFTLYCSEWEEKEITYAPIRTWRLDVEIEFLQCYSFLCSLADDKTFRSDTEKVDIAKTAQSLKEFSWRAKTPPPKRGSNKRQRQDDNGSMSGGSPGEFDSLGLDFAGHFCESFDWEQESVAGSDDVGPHDHSLVKVPEERVYPVEEGLKYSAEEIKLEFLDEARHLRAL